jgi:hypothetical protein
MTILGSSSTTLPTTSGTYNFSVVRDTVIALAMKTIGKLGEGASPTASEISDCSAILNMMVKQWMGRQDFANGLKMWTRARGELFLSSTHYSYALGPTGDNWTPSYVQQQLTAAAAQSATSLVVTSTTGMSIGDYLVIQLGNGDTQTTTVSNLSGGTTITIPAPGLTVAANNGAYVWDYAAKAQRPLNIVTALLRDTNNSDTPLNFMTLEEYEFLPTKTQPGNQSLPSSIYYESSLPNGTLYIDCGGVQDVTYHMHIVYLRPVQNLDNPGDAVDYPQQWYLALVYGLAKLIAPMFNAPWTKEMEDNYGMALAMAREADPATTALYFQPNE